MSKASPATEETIQSVFELEQTVSGWDAEYYHPIAEHYYDNAVKDMLTAMGVSSGDHVLDAGCGPGVHSIRTANYGCVVSAIDLSERMLSHARQRAEKAGVNNKITFSKNDLTNLSLESNSYPYVFNWGVIIHIPDTEAALNHLMRIVKPKGKLALHITNKHSLDFFIEKVARKIFSKPLADVQESPLGTGVWYDHNGEKLWVLRFDTQALVEYMKKSGFTLVSRRTAEFTEVQWRTSGIIRSLLLHFNRLAYKLRFPAVASCTQILVFEKTSS